MEDNKIYVSSLAFFASSLSILTIMVLIHMFVPDVLDVEYITANFFVPLSSFVAEKSEKLQYMVSVVAFPLLFFGFYCLFKKYIKNISDKFVKMIISTEIILGAAVFLISIMFSEGVKEFLSMHFANFLIPLIGVLIFITVFVFYNKKESHKKIINIASFVMGGIFIYQTFNLYNIQSLAFTEITLHHFEAYFYPIYKTLSGMTPGIDFRNIYGFYPYIYSLFFKLDNVSIPKIAMFNCILTTLTMTFFLSIVYKNIKNKITAFFIVASCALFCFLHCFYISVLYYYQYLPHRTFFVMLIVLLITIYLNIENEKIKKLIEYLGYIISSVALFWNLESGIAALAGWGSMFFYLSLNKANKIKNISLIFLKILLSFVLAFLGIFVATYIHSSQIINPLGLFFGQFIFYDKGFYMLKMNPLEQPFLLVVIPYLIALSNSIQAIIEKRETKNDAIKFSLAVIGFAVFVYFQGRSHILCLSPVSWPAFIIIGILMEEYYLKYIEFKKQNSGVSDFVSKASFVKFYLLFILFGIFTIRALFFISFTPPLINKYKQKLKENSIQIENLNFLDKNTEYDFLTKDASFYYLALKKPDLKPFAHPVDCFLKSDVQKINDYLKTSNKKLVLDEYTMVSVDMNYIYENYLLDKTNGNIYILKHK